MGSIARLLLCLTTVAQTLFALTGCGGKGADPGISARPPAYLAGVWEITDSSWACAINPQRREERTTIDTICTGGPDLAEVHFFRIWDRYWSELYGWDWDPSLASSSGGIDETGAAVQMQGTVTKGSCTAELVVWAEGTFDSNSWDLLSRLDLEFTGVACGLGADTFHTCMVFKTTFIRRAEAVEPCDDTAGLY